MRITPVADWTASVAAQAPGPATVARTNLSAMMLTADIHKLLDPFS